MNVVREIERINKAELERGGTGGSWHDEYKDSAYIFVGGLASELTEGDVITIFSQYGEPVDINLPRDKQTGKTRGFGFIMYENQKSTVLAVDNLNGAKVLGRTLRVDHVSKYKQLEKDEATGKMKEREWEELNARPELFTNQRKADDSDSEDDIEDEADVYDGIDPDDPMAAYLIQQKKEERALAIANGTHKSESKSKKRDRDGESKEERRQRKAEKRRKKEEQAGGKKREDRSASVERKRRREDGNDRQEDRRRRERSYFKDGGDKYWRRGRDDHDSEDRGRDDSAPRRTREDYSDNEEDVRRRRRKSYSREDRRDYERSPRYDDRRR